MLNLKCNVLQKFIKTNDQSEFPPIFHILHDIPTLVSLFLLLCTWAHLSLHVLLIYLGHNVKTRFSGIHPPQMDSCFFTFSLTPFGAFDSCKHMYTAGMAEPAIYNGYRVVWGGTSHLLGLYEMLKWASSKCTAFP